MQKQQGTLSTQPLRRRLLGPCATQYVAMTTGSWRLERPIVDYSNCSKCGTCGIYCPTNAIEILKENEECVEIMWDYCKGCGICANECPKKCIQMVDERSFEDGAV